MYKFHKICMPLLHMKMKCYVDYKVWIILVERVNNEASLESGKLKVHEYWLYLQNSFTKFRSFKPTEKKMIISKEAQHLLLLHAPWSPSLQAPGMWKERRLVRMWWRWVVEGGWGRYRQQCQWEINIHLSLSSSKRDGIVLPSSCWLCDGWCRLTYLSERYECMTVSCVFFF